MRDNLRKDIKCMIKDYMDSYYFHEAVRTVYKNELQKVKDHIWNELEALVKSPYFIQKAVEEINKCQLKDK
jgi:ribosome recycling factor